MRVRQKAGLNAKLTADTSCKKEVSAVLSARRVFALYSALLLGFFALICRLYWLACNTEYAARVQAQSTVMLTLPARRGGFYDCDGLPLTGLEENYLALCVPGEDNYSRLYKYTSASGQALLYQNRKTTAPYFIEVSRNVSSLGFACYPSFKRYSALPLCQHLIGYVNGEGRGVAGLEAALDEVLAGTGEADSVSCTVNAQGRLLPGTKAEYSRASNGAKGVRLTISRPVQRAAEAVAAETMTTGCILVLDVSTAKVRACVSVPGYDPNNVAASLDAADSPLVDRALRAYAVGSVFKPVLAAAALEQGLTGLRINCPGYIELDGQIYRCAGGTAHGEVDLAAALEKSCNGYFITLGRQLGAGAVSGMARRLGFGSGVSVAGSLSAAAGVLPAEEELSFSGEFANFCFGQGQLLATPVQVAGMFNAIAAGGVWRAPSFAECTLNEATGEELETLSSPASSRAFSAATAEKLRALLSGVVTNGTGREAACEPGAAGKTGTAQTGQYTAAGEELKNFWFAGFWPAAEPQYTVVVMQDSQLEVKTSSAAVFAKVCRALSLLQTE